MKLRVTRESGSSGDRCGRQFPPHLHLNSSLQLVCDDCLCQYNLTEAIAVSATCPNVRDILISSGRESEATLPEYVGVGN